MAVFSIVKLSELEGAKRMDAEYYKPEYLEIDQKIKRLKHFQFKQIISSFSSGKNLPQIECCKDKIAYIRTQNVRPILIDKEGLTCINSQVQNPPLLEEGDLLFVRVGEGVGNSSIVTSEWANSSYSDNVIRIKIRYLDPYFVIVFLNSNVGKKYLERVKKGSARSLISKENINLIKIIEPSPKIAQYCRDTIKEAQILIANSKSIYSQAESLLLEELGLKDFKPKYKKTYAAKLSDAFSAHRIDAENFQPAYEEVIQKIKQYPNGFSKLLKHIENVAPDFNPTKYPDKIFSYVELADIDSSIGVIHSVNKVKGGEAPSRARRLLKEGDVIVSSVEGSLEKVALVDKEHDSCLASTGFFQFRPLGILPEVLLVLSKSIVLQLQLKKRCSGTILTAVPKESLRDIIIPLLPLSIQQEIASLVQQSHEARKKAKELLEIAKRAVEIAIEESEEKAQEYIQKKVKS
jgi:restriction endonuclease S subunit